MYDLVLISLYLSVPVFPSISVLNNSDGGNDNMDRLCHICGRIFTKKCDLKRHVNQVHFGLRPYSCNCCDQSFKRRTQLKAHMVKFHGHDGNPPLTGNQESTNMSLLSTSTNNETPNPNVSWELKVNKECPQNTECWRSRTVNNSYNYWAWRRIVISITKHKCKITCPICICSEFFII